MGGLGVGGHVRKRVAGCDAVVLGGGNLLTDADLNFPMKIAGALRQAAALRLPVAVNASDPSASPLKPASKVIAASAAGA